MIAIQCSIVLAMFLQSLYWSRTDAQICRGSSSMPCFEHCTKQGYIYGYCFFGATCRCSHDRMHYGCQGKSLETCLEYCKRKGHMVGRCNESNNICWCTQA